MGVARRSRLIDVASLVLILGGFALYVHAYLGMDRIRLSPDVPFRRGTMEVYALTNEYWRLQKLSFVALGLVGVGIVVGLSAAAHHHMIRRGASSSTQSII